MRRLLVAAVLLVGLLGACGDDTNKVTAGDEPSGEVAQPNCVEANDSYDYTGDPSHVGAQQNDLQHDAETVRKYGEAHPDEFTQVAFENHPTVHLLGVFTDHLDEHRAALQSRLEHPDRFEVRQGLLTAIDARAIQDTIQKEPPFAGQSNASGISGHDGHVEASFFSTSKGRDAAQAAHERWGRMLCITIAGHPYPRGAWQDTAKCPTAPAPTDRNSSVEFKLVLDHTTLHRGEHGTGTARITNNGTATISAFTGTDISANVTRPGSNAIVSHDTGFHTLAGRNLTAKPGETTEIPVRFSTDDCAPNSDYSLPPGEYVVSSYVKEFGRSDDVTITIVE